MPRIPALDPASAPAKSKDTLASIQGALGAVPNMFRTLAHSPAALQAMWGFFGAMNHAALPARLREQIALAVGQANGCDYCVAAHTALGANAGLSRDDALAARRAEASDPRSAAALRFARAVLDGRGHVTDEQWSALRAAGFSNAEAVEIAAVVAQNIFTNYINHVAQPVVDFPPPPR